MNTLGGSHVSLQAATLARGGGSPDEVYQTKGPLSVNCGPDRAWMTHLSRANALTSFPELLSLPRAFVLFHLKSSNQPSSRTFHTTMRHKIGSYTNAGSQKSAEIENIPV